MRCLPLILSSTVVAAFHFPQMQLPTKVAQTLTTGAVTLCSMFAAPPTCVAQNEWQLMNGDVTLQDTTQLKTSKGPLQLSGPTLIGAGGGGAVFAFRDSPTLLKVSWKGSTTSVKKECKVLQVLQENKVESTERCLGEFDYKQDGRVMIAVEPYVEDAVASISQVEPSKQAHVVEQVARTLVQMLAANIITIDVQPLISKQTGDVIFIDMTEAQMLTPPYSFMDQTFMGSFATEMLALIPDYLVSVASTAMEQELQALATKGIILSDEAKEVLYSQTLFFPDKES